MSHARASLTIHERTAEDGSLVATHLVALEDRLALVRGGRTSPLPEGAVEAVMARYGKPLAEVARDAPAVESLDVGEGRRLVRFRFRPRYDVVARDYLALHVAGQETVCELAVAVTGALEYLAGRLEEVHRGAATDDEPR